MLYATVRATAETTTAYRRMDRQGITEWRKHAEETVKQIPDLCQRYPLSTGLEPLTPDWQENPRATLSAAVELLAKAVERTTA